MKTILLIDFGSTYTKIAAFDLEQEEVLGCAYAPSTVATNMTIGFRDAYAKLLAQLDRRHLEVDRRLACSSAAGGLRLVVIGLVPSLTTEVARRAALGAGAKLVGAYSHQLTRAELAKIEQSAPDIILLAGGTDGGNTEVVLHNSKALAGSSLICPIIVCCNKTVSEDAASYLRASGKIVDITDNVLPELGRINVEPCRSFIRETFLSRIIHGKGLDKAEELVGGIIMPTPLAVLNAAVVLAQGTANEKGWGELVVVDVGGATTDVVSIAKGSPTQASVMEKGLPEPYAKRTVEGDLGIRHNALNILELSGSNQLLKDMNIWDDVSFDQAELEAAIQHLSTHVDTLSQSRKDLLIDIVLARSAARVAMDRHSGSIEPLYTPAGTVYVQRGKDLTRVERVIGTGGIVAYGKEPRWVLDGARYDEANPSSLKPKDPEFFIDGRYILYAIGLLCEIAPEKALRIAKKNLALVPSKGPCVN